MIDFRHDRLPRGRHTPPGARRNDAGRPRRRSPDWPGAALSVAPAAGRTWPASSDLPGAVVVAAARLSAARAAAARTCLARPCRTPLYGGERGRCGAELDSATGGLAGAAPSALSGRAARHSRCRRCGRRRCRPAARCGPLAQPWSSRMASGRVKQDLDQRAEVAVAAVLVSVQLIDLVFGVVLVF